MIKNTFIILDGVGEKTERLLWQKGILSWNDFLSAEKVPHFMKYRKRLYEESLIFFLNELMLNNEKTFAEFINKKDHWRLFRHFRGKSVCLDIETNGLPIEAGGEITVLGLYNGSEFKQYVRGINLSEDAITEELSKYKLLISFYGSAFDIPFMKKKFRTLELKVPHFDLCFASKRAGFSGGLKKIEGELGFFRCEEIKNLNGYDAVKLWHAWEKGNERALDILRLYNEADTVNLLALADIVYQRLYEQSGLEKFYEKYSRP